MFNFVYEFHFWNMLNIDRWLITSVIHVKGQLRNCPNKHGRSPLFRSFIWQFWNYMQYRRPCTLETKRNLRSRRWFPGWPFQLLRLAFQLGLQTLIKYCGLCLVHGFGASTPLWDLCKLVAYTSGNLNWLMDPFWFNRKPEISIGVIQSWLKFGIWSIVA